MLQEILKDKKKLASVVFIVVAFALIIIWLVGTFYRAYLPKKQIFQGQISAKEYSVSSKLAGRIDEILVHKGDVVKKGDVVFTIKSPELEAKLTQAQEDMKQQRH